MHSALLHFPPTRPADELVFAANPRRVVSEKHDLAYRKAGAVEVSQRFSIESPDPLSMRLLEQVRQMLQHPEPNGDARSLGQRALRPGFARRVCLYRTYFAVLIASLLSVASPAQVSRTSGALTVTVVDVSGAPVVTASVEATNLATGEKRVLPADKSGHALFHELRPGSYSVKVDAPGFGEHLVQQVEVELGNQTAVEVRLGPAQVQQQVTVTARQESFDPTRTSTTTNIGMERIEESPVVTRNYLDFALLAPGLTTSNRGALAKSTIPDLDSGFSFAGQRPRSNALYIDGSEDNDEFTGANRTEFSLELVHEFQVVNNGLSAESGGAAGGSINVITRTGANQFHGDAFLFLQNGGLNAREPFVTEPQQPPTQKYRGGFSLGGPIRHNKTFFHVAIEQEHTTDEASSAIAIPYADGIDSLLATGMAPLLPTRNLNVTFPTRHNETEASLRLDHQFTSSTAMLRYSYDNSREAGDAFNAGGLNDVSVAGSSFVRDHSLVGAWTTVISPTLLNDLRSQVSTRHAVLRSNQTSGPEIDIVGVAQFGRPYMGNLSRGEDHYDLDDAVTLARGRHLFKFGAGVGRVSERVDSFDGLGGVYTFLGIDHFANGQPYQFRQRFGPSATVFATTKFAGFAQDHLAVTKRLTADLGVRYDYELLPEGFNEATLNFAPRVGVAYSPSANWVMRAGFGMFYDRYPLAYLAQALLNDGTSGFEQIFDAQQAALIFQETGGNSLPAPQATRISIYRTDPGLHTSYSEQGNLSVEHLVAARTTVTATYLFSKGVHLARARNANLASPVTLNSKNSIVPGVGEPLPQQIGPEIFGDTLGSSARDIFQFENLAGSVYHGGMLAVRSRPVNDVDIVASYTFSKCIDDASDFFEQPADPFDLNGERAVCNFDQRHRFVLSGVFDLGEESRKGSTKDRVFRNVELAPILTIGSSRPLDPVTGFDANLSHSFPSSSRPLGFARNSLATGPEVSLDLRIMKYFQLRRGKIDFAVEGFNLLNHANVLARQTDFGHNLAPLSDFARPILGGNPRQLQFSVDYEF